MRRSIAALFFATTVLFGGSPSAHATCDDVSAVRRQVANACPCSSTERGRYRRCVAAALRAAGVDADCRAEVKQILRRSLCGQKASAVVCCELRGRTVGSIKRAASRCRAERGASLCDEASRSSVAGAFFDSVSDVCSPTGTCNPLPDPCGLPGASLELTTTTSAATCGRTRDASGTVLRNLACGGIDSGGGLGTLPEATVPAGSSMRWHASCTGDTCALTPTTTPTACWDCTGPGCNFGTPLPIPNGGISVCLVSTLSGPSTGTVDRATGVVTDLSAPLATDIFLTGNELYKSGGGPCPACSASVGGASLAGTPGAPAVGVCDGGRDVGQPCRTTNPDGLSRDCRPGGVGPGAPCDPATNPSCGDGSSHLGSIPLDMTPLSTAALDRQTPDGLFCPSQRTPGCFPSDGLGGGACRRIEVAGSAAGALPPNTARAVTLASIFCVPGTGFAIVDLAADLPGPGAASLTGTLELIVP